MVLQHLIRRWYPLYGVPLFRVLRHERSHDPPDGPYCRAVRTKHIRVNAVLPGLIKTPMVEKIAGLTPNTAKATLRTHGPMGHMGDAWDVAYACLYLASDESGCTPDRCRIREVLQRGPR